MASKKATIKKAAVKMISKARAPKTVMRAKAAGKPTAAGKSLGSVGQMLGGFSEKAVKEAQAFLPGRTSKSQAIKYLKRKKITAKQIIRTGLERKAKYLARGMQYSRAIKTLRKKRSLAMV